MNNFQLRLQGLGLLYSSKCKNKKKIRPYLLMIYFKRNQLRFTEPTFLAANLYVQDSLQNAACVRIFDNDTGQELPQVLFNLRPRQYLPNKV
jgi:hypothetical protein